MPKTKAKPKRPNPDNLPELVRVQPTTKGHIDAIRRAIGPAAFMVCRLHDVDVSRGEGVIGPNSKCVWTKRGQRITFSMANGAILGTCSNERDPYDPKWKDDD